MKITIEIDSQHYDATGEMRISHEIEGARTLQDYINIGSAFELSKRMIVDLLVQQAKKELLFSEKLRGKKKDAYLKNTLVNIE